MRRYGTGAVCLLAAVVAVAIHHGNAWSWALLGLGLCVGAAGVAGTFVVGRIVNVANDRWDAYPSFVLLTIGVAILAAGLPSAWPDVAFAAYVAIANFTLPLLLLPRLARPAAHACATDSSCGATACTACPLATMAK